jgi:hypothetical protein
MKSWEFFVWLSDLVFQERVCSIELVKYVRYLQGFYDYCINIC